MLTHAAMRWQLFSSPWSRGRTTYVQTTKKGLRFFLFLVFFFFFGGGGALGLRLVDFRVSVMLVGLTSHTHGETVAITSSMHHLSSRIRARKYEWRTQSRWRLPTGLSFFVLLALQEDARFVGRLPAAASPTASSLEAQLAKY